MPTIARHGIMKAMLKINFDNLYQIDSEHGLPESTFADHAEYLAPTLKSIEERGQGFYKVIDDEGIIDEINDFAASVKGQYDDIVVCGVGGSALGPICLRDSFRNTFSNQKPRLHVLENIDPDFMVEATESLDLNRTLFLIISKSGGTPETVAQYMYFRDLTNQAKLEAKQHYVFITDPNDEVSLLRSIGDKNGIKMFDIPPSVGGRFSVQTAVGYVPAALIGIDIKALNDGLKSMRDQFLNTNVDQNLPFQLACVQTGAYLKEKPINIIMPYHTKLRQFGAWCVQLIAESTGKFKEDGTSVGITPVPALGVTDQHSQVQLFAEGPNDKLVIFISVEDFEYDLEIPLNIDHGKTNFLQGKTFKDLLHAEQQGTALALTENNRPNITITIPELSPYYLGQLFMLFEGATAFWGEFFEINAFNQPGVERGKVLTREILGT
ncbi:glucose-6-phosphate isomerase [Candidatus Parcubacteria bacterium]|nr:glucose-6-phosphate isomerase [Candidatus Parcubacteria bacterium]